MVMDLCNKNGLKITEYWPIFYDFKGEELQCGLIISFVRLSDTEQKQTLFMQLISDFITKAIRKKIAQITIHEKYLSENQKAILERLGFENQSSVWTKFLHDKVLNSSQLSELNGTIDDVILERINGGNAEEIETILLTQLAASSPPKVKKWG